MSPEKKFELGDYVEVKDRLKLFYELYGKGSIVTEEVTLTTEPDGKPRVMVRAAAYRTPDDPHPGIGYSWLELPGRTPYTNGSEVENAETSAWGRAIASLGILVDRSIASAQEVQNKAAGSPRPHEDADSSPNDAPNGEKGDREEMMGRVRRRGVIRKGSSDDYKLVAHLGPEGHVIGFRLEIDGDKNIPQCLVAGPLGEALFLAASGRPETLIGKVATVSGLLYNVRRPDKPGSWYRLHVDRIETDEWILPADEEPVLPEPPADLELVGEKVPAA